MPALQEAVELARRLDLEVHALLVQQPLTSPEMFVDCGDAVRDRAWCEDRREMTGRTLDADTLTKNRPESLAHARMYFNTVENELLADGRDYLLNTAGPTLADIHAIWTFDWTLQPRMHMYEYLEKEVINERLYPKTFAWVDRFRRFIAERQRAQSMPQVLSSDETIDRILKSGFFESEGTVDALDPLRLKKGQLVEIWPIESGFTRHDRGELVSIGVNEVVIACKPNAGQGQVRIHFPRTNFRIQPVAEARL